ncbi:MAG TPA: sulfotransferase [Hyphomonas sp.]|nr:hypothetical protein [Hyphomonas sp.]HRJ01133.1 sulfotransferase [Hyphomonas sp.]HRK67935.1 sulfotransferase [Hyphomonas sp.]
MSIPPGVRPPQITPETARHLQEGRARLNRGDLPGAADLAQGLLRRNGSLPEAWLLLCSALIRMGSADDDRALGDALSAIPVAHPLHSVLAVERCRVLARRGRCNEAVSLARLIEAHVRLDARQHDTLSNVYTNSSLFDAALRHSDLAIAQMPDDLSTIYNRGMALRHLGRIDEAVEHFERLIRMRQDDAMAFFALSDCKRWTPGENHIAAIETALGLPHIAPEDRVRLNFALYKEAHDTGDHGKAWAALSEGCRLASLPAPFDVAERTAYTASMIRNFTGGLDTPPTEGPAPVPVFIVGLPRSGTTLVERIFSAHPDVTDMGETHGISLALRDAAGLSRFGELDDASLSRLPSVNWSQVARLYLESLSYRRPQTRFFTEKLPHNYYLVGPMRRAFPQARFVHLRRAPMDTLFGAYKILFGEGSYLWSYRFEDLAAAYRLYRQVTDHWRAELGASFVEVTLETLIEEPETEIRRILAGTGLSFHPDCLAPHKAAGGVSTASSAQVRQPINRQGVGAWRTYAAQLEPLRKLLEADGFVDANGDPVW